MWKATKAINTQFLPHAKKTARRMNQKISLPHTQTLKITTAQNSPIKTHETLHLFLTQELIDNIIEDCDFDYEYHNLIISEISKRFIQRKMTNQIMMSHEQAAEEAWLDTLNDFVPMINDTKITMTIIGSCRINSENVAILLIGHNT